MEQSIANSMEMGLKELMQYGLLGVLAAIGLAVLLWSTYNCSRSTKESLDNNTTALNEIKLVLEWMKGKNNK